MKKYIANIEISGPVTDFTLCVDGVCTIPDDGTEFYLASEVDEFLAGINDADDARDEVIRKEIAAKDARIAELEKGLREIKELSPFSHEQDVTVVENIISRLMVRESP